jgi:hypothetical protein
VNVGIDIVRALGLRIVSLVRCWTRLGASNSYIISNVFDRCSLVMKTLRRRIWTIRDAKLARGLYRSRAGRTWLELRPSGT